jgi:hypothetical protein
MVKQNCKIITSFNALVVYLLNVHFSNNLNRQYLQLQIPWKT